MGHLALWQGMTHEHRVHSLQIELGSEIHDSEIFIVKLAMFLRGVAIALHQMKKELAVLDAIRKAREEDEARAAAQLAQPAQSQPEQSNENENEETPKT